MKLRCPTRGRSRLLREKAEGGNFRETKEGLKEVCLAETVGLEMPCVRYLAGERAQDLESIGYQKEEFGRGDTLESFPACGDLGYLVKQ